jgi:hypothetical protein
MTWSKRFDVPVKLPNGGRIETLDQARRYLLELPEADHSEMVGIAAEALVMAAEGRGPMMHANVGIANVVYGPRQRPHTPRQKSAKTYRILK